MSGQRVTEEFVKLLRLLDEKTAGNPSNLELALDKYPEIERAVDQLSTIWSILEEHKHRSSRKLIVQAHPDFLAAVRRYEAIWTDSWIKKSDWKARIEGRPTLSDEIGELLDAKPVDHAGAENGNLGESWDFEPDVESAASLIDDTIDNLSGRAEYEPFFAKACGAFEWFNKTVGVKFGEIEKRWRDFPVLVVKENVSDHYGTLEQRSLYAYLENVRRAYVFGAELAALAMCRTITEILFRFHFNPGDEKTNLTPLIKRTLETRPELNRFNLVDKVDEANKLLHFSSKIEVAKWKNIRVLVRNWFSILNELIDLVPARLK